MTPADADRYRLPRTVTPSRYELTVRPDLEAARFSGHVAIEVTVHEPVDEIVLNAAALELSGARVTGAQGAIDVSGVAVDEELQRATLTLAATAAPGAWVLELDFAAPFDERLRGFYLSTYRDDDGAFNAIATTQFEAADARRAFPCWDEPDLKAVFAITLEVPADLTAVSNAAEIGREEIGGGLVRVRFDDTMVMSTYLVAYVIGRLEITEPVDAGGVAVRVVHAPGKGHLATYALETAVASLRFFTDYYDLPCPTTKMDMVAMPDFAQGAMENTGCIIYREASLLVDPALATQPELENIADVVAHELAHMWFGNLVTMRWWNGIWLNEAFATFMALIAVESMRPDWERWASFARFASIAKDVDALESTRPIEFVVHSPADAAGMFDVLTYQKGGAILRMLERYLGPERFRDGIRHYLKLHAFGNTETHDLWDAIEQATGEPVRRVMDQWIWQGGYPVVNVASTAAGIHLSQRRFRADGAEDPTTWETPLRVRDLAGDERSVLLDRAGADVSASAGSASLVNAGVSAFVRVGYADALLEDLTGRLGDLTALERFALVDDRWAAVVAGHASVAAFVDLAERFGGDDDLSVWQAIVTGLGWCDRFLTAEPREGLRTFARRLLAPALERLQWEAHPEDPDRVRALRGELLQGLAVLGADPNAIAAAREFESEERAGRPVDPSLASASVSIVAREGGLEDYERFVWMTQHAPTPQAQLRYLYALPLFRLDETGDRMQAAVLDGSIRSQSAPFVMAFALTNRDQGPRAWAFIKREWSRLSEGFPPPLVVRMVDGVRYLTLPEQVEDVEAFFAAHPIPQSERTLRQTLERQKVMARLRARATPELEHRFAG